MCDKKFDCRDEQEHYNYEESLGYGSDYDEYSFNIDL